MKQTFANCYDDARRAEAYATLEFERTYHLAFRDLPEVLRNHVHGRKAVDFGCGTGRSTRFLRRCGFDVVGIDIADAMIAKARELDPEGEYRLIRSGDFGGITARSADLVLSAFTFDNIAAAEKELLFRGLAALLRDHGVLVSIVSSPEIYLHDWASFSTTPFPENRLARSGDVVKIITTDHGDSRAVEDVLCTGEAYREVYRRAGLEVVETREPLASGDEPWTWVSETRIAPWIVYVLRRQP